MEQFNSHIVTAAAGTRRHVAGGERARAASDDNIHVRPGLTISAILFLRVDFCSGSRTYNQQRNVLVKLFGTVTKSFSSD
jgi:hypothetical protein